jgi:1-deoxy-D-xylulose-5-phosphate reductoisomerase
MRHITLLGSTGSIGTQALDIVATNPDRFTIFALTAHRNIALLWQQCCRFQPRYVVVADADLAKQLSQKIQHENLKTCVLIGEAAICEVASNDEVDTVVSAIVGAAGLMPTMAAITAGKRVLLANKESLVMAGELMMSAVRQHNTELLPIDSEHNALFQCFPAGCMPGQSRPAGVHSIVLTASGGPFREMALDKLRHVTPEQAIAHPNWSMGAKTSVDSATMMNKGLEIIEARWLFDFMPKEIDVVIHPQSLVHALVRYHDGSVLAHFAKPDMHVPIAHALAWPERIASGVDFMDFDALLKLTFSPPDLQRYPCLKLAYQALEAGGTAMVLLNAANERAVSAFLSGQLAFHQIAEVVDGVLDKIPLEVATSLEAITLNDQKARAYADKIINSNRAIDHSKAGV